MKMRAAVLAVVLALVGCMDDSTTSPPVPPPPPVPTAIALSPEAALTFNAVGDTIRLSATVRDQYGHPMPDQPIRWHSSASAVASVDAGLVTANANGVASIIASLGQLADSTTVVVDDPIAAEHAPDRAALLAFFDQANGPQWHDHSGWGEERVPMGEWYGVTTAFDSAVGRYRVERLHLPDNNLRGTRLPKELGDLTHLVATDLHEAVWSEGGDYWNCSVCPPATAIPVEIMNLHRLDSLRVGRFTCAPATDTTLLAWLWEREFYRSPNIVTGIQYARKTAPCLNPADIREVRVRTAQAVDLGDTLIAGRDAWIAVQPIGVKRPIRHSSFDSTEVYQRPDNRWPAMRGRVCGAPGNCIELDLPQLANDTVSHLLWTDYDFVRGKRENAWWNLRVGVSRIPGDMIGPETRITIEMDSRTIGDTIRIASHEMTPTVIPETPPLEITLVVVVPPNRECRSSALNGNGPTENCYEWPDSSFARLDTLKSNHDILFQHLKHWYPVSEVDVVWHTEYLYSRTWNRVRSVWESASSDLGRLGTMMEDDGRYWVGLWCLVGYCTGGFGGPSGLATGRRSMTVPYGPVLAHEIGHNLGLWHPDEDPEVSIQLDALAIGKWSGPCTPVNGGWECVYAPDPIHPNQFTFMHSYFTNRTAADGEGIAPWQLRFLYERLSGRSIPVEQSDRVIVN